MTGDTSDKRFSGSRHPGGERIDGALRSDSGMGLEFREAVLPDDGLALWRLDVAIFGRDAFPLEDWLSLESYWIVVDGQVAGSAAFIRDVEFQEDLPGEQENTEQPGTIYIQSTGLLPEFRGRGLGKQIKGWQIEFAKRNGFRRILTNCRESNAAMLSINQKFGFQAIRITPDYYEDGEATVVMELLL
jgi:ribosomal protein S18 acetylase RimI-like enzyme